MKVLQRFETQHEDIVHDIAYEFYGKRLATCSSDQKIKVWDMEENGEWKQTAEWKAHSGSVWRLQWAHPEFGQVLASCSFDRQVIIWEEGDGNNWTSKSSLTDSRDSVQDIKFAPHHFGLKLATCSADGVLRIYEAPDVMNLSHWPLQDEFPMQKHPVTCVAWNPSRFDTSETLAMASGDTVSIWMHTEQRKWQQLVALTDHADDVHDVAWAANLGRSYHLIATASKDRCVRIYKATFFPGDAPRVDAELIASFNDHNSEVWRVEWNLTGTILASSGDDGTVRLYKSNYVGEWKQISVIAGEDESDALDTSQ
eukprot:TRINITY_DN3339_c0_g1_i1.p1 TRINITY_DN3339_c0_g1~~TRINITY_DN3339_c0_g1_i1.p1  ORF type:complete len:334 (-),score=50.12 TRINITY_DN3339_c0_g1_i1:1075-2010(-)